MGFFDNLTRQLQGQASGQQANPNYSENLKAVEQVLEGFPEEKARYLAALALLMGRIAYADQEVSDKESGKMVKLFRDMDLDPPTAQALTELAIQRTLFNNLEDHLVLRQLRELTQHQKEKRREVMRALFALASESDVSSEENEQLRLIAKALDFSQREFQEIRLEFRDYIALLRDY